MKAEIMALFLSMTLLVLSSDALQAGKVNPLSAERDVKKIQKLIRTTNYSRITEGDFIAVRKHLSSLASETDISTDEGKNRAGILYMAIINFTQYTKNPKGNRDHVTQEWQDMKASDFAKNLKGKSQKEFVKMLNDKYPSDTVKLKDEFRGFKTVK